MPEPETCESCGRAFGCGARDGACWCDDVPLTVEAREALAAEFRRCLCPECLATRAGREPAAS